MIGYEIIRKKDYNQTEFSYIGKTTCLAPSKGFVNNNVQRLLLTSGSDNHLNYVPMAIFVEQA